MAKAAGFTAVISHRSGETEDAPLLIWLSGPGRVRSRPARCAALTGWLSTTGYCGLKRSWASPRRILAGTFSRGADALAHRRATGSSFAAAVSPVVCRGRSC